MISLSGTRILVATRAVVYSDNQNESASHAVMSGLDLYTAGRLLSHADTCSTERYAHLADDSANNLPWRSRLRQADSRLRVISYRAATAVTVSPEAKLSRAIRIICSALHR